MLKPLIHDWIKQHGFINVADYMRLCLLHPTHGYYTNQTVFGATGDFVTAPEISQLFGEILGVWAVLEWERLGHPHAVNLIECGPGSGTLMRDLLRGVGHVKPFQQAVRIHLVEASAQLQAQQRQAITHPSIQWHDKITASLFDRPAIIIANEFLDALPIRQCITRSGQWHERVIISRGDDLVWSTHPLLANWPDLPDATQSTDNDIVEYGADARSVFDQLCRDIKTHGGSMALVDYGDYLSPRIGDTLQAVKQHEFVDVLTDCGQADLTAHVDFYALDQIARHHQLRTTVINQGEFLKLYGIEQRLHVLLQRVLEDGIQDAVLAGYQRLTDPDQMGHLFKVLLVQTP